MRVRRIGGRTMKVEMTEEAKKRILSECRGIHFEDGKFFYAEPMGYCKFCGFQSNDGFEQQEHFNETGHNCFLPINLIHERVGKARLMRPWDNEEDKKGLPKLRCAA